MSWGSPKPATPDTTAAAERYLHDRVENASPAELTGMLFTEALRCIDTAHGLFAADKHLDALPLIVKAQDIVVELRTALNPDAGDLAIQLDSLYTWIYSQLITANMQRSVKALVEARSCLAPLAEAWAQISAGATA